MNTTKIAKEIKALLVEMASKDELPLDMNELNLDGIEAILNRNDSKFITEKFPFLKDGEVRIFDAENVGNFIDVNESLINYLDDEDLIFFNGTNWCFDGDVDDIVKIKNATK